MQYLHALADYFYASSAKRTRPYVPLCILTIERSGSSLLQHTLNVHPSVLIYGEVFHPRTSSRFIAMKPGKHLPPVYDGGSSSRYIQQTLFPPYLNGKQAIGFKLSPQHADCLPDTEKFWQELSAVPGLKVIQLERKNHLDILLSRQVAQRDKVWAIAPKNRMQQRCQDPIHIDYTLLTKSILGYEQVYAQCTKLLPEADRLYVTYDEIAYHTTTCIRHIHEWLGLEPITPRPDWRPVKQRIIPRREAILNFDELRSRIAAEHPQWLRYFDEEEPFLTRQ